MSIRELAAIAVRQHGLISRDQALRVLGEGRTRHWRVTGRLEAVRPGVYRLPGAPPTWQQGLLGAVLAAGPGAVASHRSAAALHGLVDRVGPPELTAPSPRWVRLPGVRAHRTNCLPDHHRVVVTAVPVTSLARTVLDMSAVVPPERLGQLLDHAHRVRPTLVSELETCLDEVKARGRRRTAVMREILALRHEDDRPGGSNWEVARVRDLRAAELGLLVQQHKVTVRGRVYYLDAAYPIEMVAVEFDTFHTHGARSSFDRDRRRDADLQLLGWLVLRATSTMTTLEILTMVRDALALRRGIGSHDRARRGKVGG